MDYTFDQRTCDIFTILTTILDILERDKDNTGFMVTKIEPMHDDQIYTL